MGRITCESFLQLRYLSDPVVSPDGRHTAYICRVPNMKTNGYDVSLWLAEHGSGEVRCLKWSGPAGSFYWRDGRTLVFAGRSSAEATTLMAMPIDGGEPYELFTIPAKAGKFAALDDGRIVFTTVQNLNQPCAEGGGGEEHKSVLDGCRTGTYDVLEDVPFWGNGAGITSGRRTRLGVFDPVSGKTELLTSAPFDTAGFAVEGSRVLYVGSDFTGIKTLRQAVCVWDGETGETVRLIDQDRFLVKLYALHGDTAVLCLTDGLSYGNGENGDFYTVKLSGGEPSLFREHSAHCIGSTVGTDCRLGGGSSWKICGDTLYYISTVERGSRIEALDLNTGDTRVLTGEGSVECLDIAGGRLTYLAFRGNRPGELYTMENGAERQLTHSNDAFLEGVELSAPEPVEVDTLAPVPIQGWVMKPLDYTPGRKYPAILSIHGGPRLSYGDVFFHEMQMLAAEGYFVIFCNPRGSEGRGNEFADIRGRFGSIDYDDLMRFLDGVLARFRDIDPERLGVGGGSYGGFMTNWIIGHTKRFRAACSQRSISDWTGMEGTADIGYYFAKGQIGVSHREERQKQWEHSPLKYADHADTPTLFLHSECDYRCHKLEALNMFTSLKLRGVDTRLCLFEGENHELSRSGRPRQRLKRLEEMLHWYNRYLKDMEE